MKHEIDYTLYLVTDREFMSANTLERAVEEAIVGGCTVIQLREKMASSLEFYRTALNIKAITDKYRVPLIINDRVDIALAVDADGIHLGQRDLPAGAVRKIISNDKIMGVSVSNFQEAVKAVADGADYLGVGAMYATDSKRDAEIVSLAELKTIRNAVDIPIVVIGGINKNTVQDFVASGIDGLAVISAVISQKDIAGAAKELITMFRGGTSNSPSLTVI